MKKVLLVDYSAYITLKVLGPFLRVLPRGFSLFLGRRIGDLVWLLDSRHRLVAYANIRQALGDKLSPRCLTQITRKFYRNFGQNIIEIFFIPAIDSAYIKKYISFEGLEHIEEAFKQGKGIIFVSVHAGSWELSSIICSNLGIPFSLLVRDQRYPRLERLLNSYRSEKGCRFIQRENQLREIIRALKNNESIGMSLDQGGFAGERVNFFDKEASMASGAVKLALKYDAPIIPTFYVRVKGPYIKTIIAPAYRVKRGDDPQADVQYNLQELVRIFEKFIRQYPQEYLWTYKIWKHGRARRILILSDAKTGHLRQSEAVARAIENIYLKRGIRAETGAVEVRFKSGFSKLAFMAGSVLSGKYNCQGCLGCFTGFLDKETCRSLSAARPDVIISCGFSLSAVNFILSRENNAKSICIMRPGILSTRRFDAVLIPRHDDPPRRKNIALTEGALNIIDEAYLKEQSQALLAAGDTRFDAGALYLGLLLGGDTRNFSLEPETVKTVVAQLKEAAEGINAYLLVTSSRRTPAAVEKFLKEELADYPRCRLLVIASEKNPAYAVGGILALSKCVVVSPESISMVSEAASSGRPVLVFKSRVDNRHSAFLHNLADKEYIHLVEAERISSAIRGLWTQNPVNAVLNDSKNIEEFLAGRL
ncbi:MAG: ELM1/GtrOC1 family putative glycosyltransferase [Candidatus Omnitrophica bacterium]|nr:ELM1/GtrOC1 family putative glycosyltransferase [Candidatus Omnitrophota bacterium]